MAVLGTVIKSCSDLRVTAAGFIFTNAAIKDRNYQRCKKPANTRLMGDMVTIVARTGGDTEQGTQLWCTAALATFDIVGGGLVEPK